jgi:hypothetical protein
MCQVTGVVLELCFFAMLTAHSCVGVGVGW